MKIICLLILAIIPILLIGTYIYKKDKKKEPKKLLFKLFLGGILSCIFVLIIFSLLSIISIFSFDTSKMNFIEKLINVFIGVALVEELCKWFILYKIGYKDNEFDELYDMIIYSSFISLGFAFFENIFYVLDGGFSVGILRAISAVPGHVWGAVFMGNYLGMAKIYYLNGRKDLEKRNILLSVIVPTILHGIYDFCLEYENILSIIIFLIFIIIMYILSIKKIKKISSINISFIKENNYCTNCGNVANGNYCSMCGNKIIKKNIDNSSNLMI